MAIYSGFSHKKWWFSIVMLWFKKHRCRPSAWEWTLLAHPTPLHSTLLHPIHAQRNIMCGFVITQSGKTCCVIQVVFSDASINEGPRRVNKNGFNIQACSFLGPIFVWRRIDLSNLKGSVIVWAWFSQYKQNYGYGVVWRWLWSPYHSPRWFQLAILTFELRCFFPHTSIAMNGVIRW